MNIAVRKYVGTVSLDWWGHEEVRQASSDGRSWFSEGVSSLLRLGVEVGFWENGSVWYPLHALWV